MEKRRRARINNCLNELKTLILDAMKKDVSIFNIISAQHDVFSTAIESRSFRFKLKQSITH